MRQPASGYDLKQHFQATVANFWPARLSQIYPTLQRLERKGHLRSRRESSEKGPARRVYSRTKRGRAELRRWLRLEPQRGTERFGYLGQLAFMEEVGDPAATEAFVRALRDQMAGWLERLKAIEREIESECGAWNEVDEETFHAWITLRAGIHTVAARVEWLDETLERLEVRRKRTPAAAQVEEG
ncbi:MAG: PadR family transcriptional regulator [Gemmatimonadota bacterium]